MILFFLGLAAAAAPLHFDHLPLGSVARVLSARFQTPITILAQAASPVTGDFSQLTLNQSLTLAADQVGLVVRAEGAGFIIGPKLPDPPVKTDPVVSPAERRAALLRRRTELLEQAAKLRAP
jgi:hypothetical protein